MNTIFKTWTTPLRPEHWAKYCDYKLLLNLLMIGGMAISGSTEFKASDTIMQGIGTVLLFEGGAVLAAGMFFGNLFSLIQSGWKDTFSWLFGIIGLILLCFIVYGSYNTSTIGVSNKVNEQTIEPTAVKTDSSKHKTMTDMALSQYASDTAMIISTNSNAKDSVRNGLYTAIAVQKKEKARIMAFGDYDYSKYKVSIVRIDTRIAAYNKELRGLNKVYKRLYDSEIAKAGSKKNGSFAAASGSLISSQKKAEIKTDKNATKYENDVSYKTAFGNLLVFLGIFFTSLNSFLYYLARHLSKSYVTSKNPFAGIISPFERISYGMSLHIRFLLDAIADAITPSSTVNVVNKTFAFGFEGGEKMVLTNNQNSAPTLLARNGTNQPAHGIMVQNANMQIPMAQAVTTPNNEEQIKEHEALKQFFNIGEEQEESNDIPANERAIIGFMRSTGAERIEEPAPEPIAAVPPAPIVIPAPTAPTYEGNQTSRVGANQEEIDKLTIGFNYHKQSIALKAQFNKLLATKDGTKGKTKNWKETANDRAGKFATLVQLLVKQGYRIDTISTVDGWILNIDDVENKSLGNLPAAALVVDVFAAPNDYKFPIFIKYPNLAVTNS